MPEKVPIREGIFKDEVEGGVLVGSKCRSCGQILFPPDSFCIKCFKEDMEPVDLSREGTLYSYSISYAPTANFPPPYAAGWISLPEGLTIFSLLKDWDKDELKVGMDMEVVIDTLWASEEKEVVGYKFRPLKGK